MGGSYSDFRVLGSNDLYERNKADNTSAYVLYYIREDQRETILEPPSDSEISDELAEKFTKEIIKFNKIYLREEAFRELEKLHILTDQTIAGWDSFSAFPCVENIQEGEPLLTNTEYRKQILVLKKMTFYQLYQLIMEQKVGENSRIHTLLFYKVEFAAKTSSNTTPKVLFIPVEDLNQEIFAGNSKRNLKKSIIYIKAISNPESVIMDSVNLFKKIDAEGYSKILEEEEELRQFSKIHQVSEYTEFEHQKYMFRGNTQDSDNFDLENLRVKLAKRSTKAPKTQGNSSKSKNNKSKPLSHSSDELSPEEESHLTSLNQLTVEITSKHALVFVKYFDAHQKKFIVLGDLLLDNEMTAQQVKDTIFKKHNLSHNFIRSKLKIGSVNLSKEEKTDDVDMYEEAKIDTTRDNDETANDLNHDKASLVFFEESGSQSYSVCFDITLKSEESKEQKYNHGDILIYSFTDSKNDLKAIHESIEDHYFELRITLWADLVEKDSLFAPLPALLQKRIRIETINESTEDINYNYLCAQIIRELGQIRDLPEKLTFEYLQFYKCTSGKGNIKELKPIKLYQNKKLNLDALNINQISSDGYKIHFEVMPIKVETLIKRTLVIFQAYDENLNLLLRSYVPIENNAQGFQLKTKIFSKLETKLKPQNMGSCDSYLLFRQNSLNKNLALKENSTNPTNNIYGGFIYEIIGLNTPIAPMLKEGYEFRMQRFDIQEIMLTKEKDTSYIFLTFFDVNNEPLGSPFVMIVASGTPIGELEAMIMHKIEDIKIIKVGD